MERIYYNDDAIQYIKYNTIPQTPKVTGLDRATKDQELCASSEAGNRWTPQAKAIGDSFPKDWASLIARLVKSHLQCR